MFRTFTASFTTCLKLCRVLAIEKKVRSDTAGWKKSTVVTNTFGYKDHGTTVKSDV